MGVVEEIGIAWERQEGEEQGKNFEHGREGCEVVSQGYPRAGRVGGVEESAGESSVHWVCWRGYG